MRSSSGRTLALTRESEGMPLCTFLSRECVDNVVPTAGLVIILLYAGTRIVSLPEVESRTRCSFPIQYSIAHGLWKLKFVRCAYFVRRINSWMLFISQCLKWSDPSLSAFHKRIFISGRQRNNVKRNSSSEQSQIERLLRSLCTAKDSLELWHALDLCRSKSLWNVANIIINSVIERCYFQSSGSNLANSRIFKFE